MKNIFLTVLALYVLMQANAQNQIKGRVTDVNKEPLTGATVYMPELQKGTVTDRDGNYFISNIPKGKIKIQFSFVGYNTLLKTIKVTQPETKVNVSLTTAVIESQDVVVTGGYIGSQHDNIVKIGVLKSKAFKFSGTPDFMAAVAQVPGVDMISKGQGIAKPVIRGLSMNDVLVLNNGVRIENYQFSEDHPIGIDDNDVGKIEIVKGPASLLYGSDAIGGVINFIKENPVPIGTVAGDYRMQIHSNTLGMNNGLGLKGASKKFFGGVRIGNKTHADYLQGGGDFVPNSRFNEMTFNANTGYTGKIGTFKVYYDYFKQKLGMTVPPVVPLVTERGRKNDVWFQDLLHQMVSSRNKLYLGKFKWEINAAYQNALRKLETTLDVPVVEMRLNTYTYESKLNLPSGERSEYVIGFQGTSQNNRNLNDRKSQFLPDADINYLGFLGIARYDLFEKVKVQGGLRFDTYKIDTYAMGEEGSDNYHQPVSKDFSNVNGSVGATYRPNENLILRLNFAKGYRAPNLSELTSNGMHGNRYEIGNPDLLPENSYETDVSMHFHSECLSFDVAGFYNYINDYIYSSPTQDTTATGIDIYRFEQANATLAGGEAGIHFHPKRLPWLHVKGTFSSVMGVQQNGDYLPFIPVNKLRYEVRADKKKLGFLHNSNVKVAALTAFAQNKPSPFETRTDGYTLVNISAYSEIFISKQVLRLGLSVNNLFDKKYFDHLSTLKPVGFYDEGRNISLTLDIPFGIVKREGMEF